MFFIPIWLLGAVAVGLAALAGLLFRWRVQVRCLRYCYRMLAYHTPPEQLSKTIVVHHGLMRLAGMKPIWEEIVEPHPFCRPERALEP